MRHTSARVKEMAGDVERVQKSLQKIWNNSRDKRHKNKLDKLVKILPLLRARDPFT